MSLTESSPVEAPGNAPAYSVSELAFALKRTLEDAYGFVRLRGEISKVTRHASGHVYLSLKDERSAIDAVVWKGQVRGLGCQPETGLEVIVTGRITTYPARSSYQLVIETMEPAGVGALLAQLERLKERMRAEGLFDPARKRPLPPSPAVIGVITSPTGAVIRDILHRITDRWPCRVLVWPVVVQGADASAQVAAAVRGFNAVAGSPALPRPDVIIVARGGGSIEDLWPFNDEALARTVAASAIPVISAVGHETDTTLIDFVSDRRAPTPTAAAEMATPVRSELMAQVLGLQQRILRAAERAFELRRARLALAERGLPRPDALLGLASQRFDLAAGRLASSLGRNLDSHERGLERAALRLTPALAHRSVEAQAQKVEALAVRLDRAGRRLAPRAAADARLPALAARLNAAMARNLERQSVRLERTERLLRTLHPEAPLSRGFALVHREDGALVRQASTLRPGDTIKLKFIDGAIGARVDGAPTKPLSRKLSPPDQGNLF